jgi:hypothetical protein
MIRKTLIAGFAALALAVPGVALAAENSLITAYKTMCEATGGSLAKAVAAADAAGWAPVPDSMIAESMTAMGEMKVQEMASRVMVIDRRFVALVVGVGEMDQGDSTMEASLCGVVTFADGDTNLRAAAVAYNGTKPVPMNDPEMKGFDMWLYVDGPKGREYFTSLESMKVMRAMLDGQLNMLMVGEDEGMSMIMRMRPIMAEKN